jgi:hypothetical protein
MRKGILILVAAFAIPVWASQPGQRLTWNDCQVVLPGVYSEHFLGPDTQGGWDGPLTMVWSWKEGDSVGATGAVYYLDNVSLPCGPTDCNRSMIKRVRVDGSIELVAYVNNRYSPQTDSWDIADIEGLGVDNTNGYLYLKLRTYCSHWNSGSSCNYSETNYGHEVIRLRGLDTLFEILQTYTPTADALQFRVPAHPEGLRSADYFDTYWGNVSELPDFTQAQPMECHYPPTPPAVGDYLTVADTSPQPPPGAANYTVTAVTSGTQRRYGRKLINGVMSGRDPALLPGCP